MKNLKLIIAGVVGMALNFGLLATTNQSIEYLVCQFDLSCSNVQSFAASEASLDQEEKNQVEKIARLTRIIKEEILNPKLSREKLMEHFEGFSSELNRIDIHQVDRKLFKSVLSKLKAEHFFEQLDKAMFELNDAEKTVLNVQTVSLFLLSTVFYKQAYYLYKVGYLRANVRELIDFIASFKKLKPQSFHLKKVNIQKNRLASGAISHQDYIRYLNSLSLSSVCFGLSGASLTAMGFYQYNATQTINKSDETYRHLHHTLKSIELME